MSESEIDISEYISAKKEPSKIIEDLKSSYEDFMDKNENLFVDKKFEFYKYIFYQMNDIKNTDSENSKRKIDKIIKLIVVNSFNKYPKTDITKDLEKIESLYGKFVLVDFNTNNSILFRSVYENYKVPYFCKVIYFGIHKLGLKIQTDTELYQSHLSILDEKNISRNLELDLINKSSYNQTIEYFNKIRHNDFTFLLKSISNYKKIKNRINTIINNLNKQIDTQKIKNFYNKIEKLPTCDIFENILAFQSDLMCYRKYPKLQLTYYQETMCELEVQNNSPQIIMIFLKWVGPFQRNWMLKNFHKISQKKASEFLKELVNGGIFFDKNLFDWVATCCSFKELKFLTSNGYNNYTIASTYFNTVLRTVLTYHSHSKYHVIEYLINHNAKIDFDCLDTAICYGNVRIFKLLENYFINCQKIFIDQDQYDKFFCLSAANGRLNIFKYLSKKSVNVQEALSSMAKNLDIIPYRICKTNKYKHVSYEIKSNYDNSIEGKQHLKIIHYFRDKQASIHRVKRVKFSSEEDRNFNFFKSHYAYNLM